MADFDGAEDVGVELVEDFLFTIIMLVTALVSYNTKIDLRSLLDSTFEDITSSVDHICQPAVDIMSFLDLGINDRLWSCDIEFQDISASFLQRFESLRSTSCCNDLVSPVEGFEGDGIAET